MRRRQRGHAQQCTAGATPGQTSVSPSSQRLNQTYRQLLNDNESLTADHKQLKSQLNEARLQHTWLEADFSKLKKDFQQLDITSTKVTNQCEVLTRHSLLNNTTSSRCLGSLCLCLSV